MDDAPTDNLAQDILPRFCVQETGKVIVNGAPLAQCLMDGFIQGIVRVGLPSQDEGETVKGIVVVVHEYLDILQDASGKVLCFINGKEE